MDEREDRATGEMLKSRTIITEPNKIAAEIHDRMPVILEPVDFDAWRAALPWMSQHA